MQKKQAEREAAEELRREVEFIIEPRRCVHIKMPSELHADFRVFGLRKKLSMQEMFIEFVRLITDGDTVLIGGVVFTFNTKIVIILVTLLFRLSYLIFDKIPIQFTIIPL
jgi:hypothetical protein